MTRILLVEDNQADARLFGELLSEVPGRPFQLTTVARLADATVAAASHDVVFLDLSLPDAHGLATVSAMVTASRSTPIVVLTGNDNEQVALEAMKAGAQDYLTKSEITPSLLARTARYAVERKRADEDAQRLAIADTAVRRARFVSSITGAVTASFDLDVTLVEVARLAIPTLGDFCIIDLVRDGKIARVAHATCDPALDDAMRALYESPPGPEHPESPVLRAISTRASVLHPAISMTLAPTAAYRASVERMGVRAMLVTPLIARDRIVGTMTYLMGPSGRAYDEDLQLLAEELAERIALGIDNASLYASARSAIRSREELLAVVSHDLRNPLNVVQLALAMIKDDPDVLAGALPRAERGVQRMQRLIEDLLELARIDAGTLHIDAQGTEVTSIIDDIYEQHRGLAQTKGISLVREGSRLAVQAVADRHRLGQALTNLLGNSLKFTPTGGTIRIGAETRADGVVFSISDTGSGIAREHLDHIFDRFWQPEQRRDGVGLGLAIVKGIVDAHQGSIEVESSPGQGTTFRIVLAAEHVPALAVAP